MKAGRPIEKPVILSTKIALVGFATQIKACPEFLAITNNLDQNEIYSPRPLPSSGPKLNAKT